MAILAQYLSFNLPNLRVICKTPDSEMWLKSRAKMWLKWIPRGNPIKNKFVLKSNKTEVEVINSQVI